MYQCLNFIYFGITLYIKEACHPRCVCVKIGKGMQSNTSMPIKVYVIAILDNYMFRPLLAIFRLSSRELKVLIYTLCAHVVQRSLHTGLIA